MAEIVHTPTPRHRCDPGWEAKLITDGSTLAHLREYGYTHHHVMRHDRAGTVRRCECGRTWVAYKSSYPGDLTTHWRPEGRFERRRRERRAAEEDRHG
jgi:hypothetical protein